MRELELCNRKECPACAEVNDFYRSIAGTLNSKGNHFLEICKQVHYKWFSTPEKTVTPEEQKDIDRMEKCWEKNR